MKELHWIKMNLNCFDDITMSTLYQKRNGDSLCVFWLMLLTLAGSINDDGHVYTQIDKKVSIKALAKQCELSNKFVREALQEFASLKLIRWNGTDTLQIVDWSKYTVTR